MNGLTQTLVFGDAVPYPLHSSILKLYKASHESEILRRYLQVYSAALQDAINHLPYSERPTFQARDLLELSELHLHNGCYHIALTFLLGAGVNLGWLILHLDSELDLLRADRRKVIVGLCAGQLHALMATICADAEGVLRIVPETVRLSIAIGLSVAKRSNDIEQTKEPWGSVLDGMPEKDVREAISEFHASSGLPKHKQICISAVFPPKLTINAPPSTLKRFSQAYPDVAKAAKFKIPSSQALHTPNLSVPNRDSIVDACPFKDVLIPENVVLVSPHTGEALKSGSTFGEALHEAMVGIYAESIQWPKIERSLQSHQGDQGSGFAVFGLGMVPKLLKEKFSPCKDIAGELLDPAPPLSASTQDDIAVVGLAGRFPGSESLDDFWRIFMDGRDLMQKVPPDRFDLETNYDPTGKRPNTSLTPFGYFIDKPGFFDRNLFRMSPNEAKQTDPMGRLQLMTCHEALEMSGYSYDRTSATEPRAIGTFFAQTSDDYRQVNSVQDIQSFYIPGGIRAFNPGRVNYLYGFAGPSYNVDTACSASFAAIHLACESLRSRECSTTIASASNIMTSPANFAGLTRGGFVSPTGACKTLDQTADGFCRADAVATVVLKRLSDAVSDNDNIYGVIKATATSSSPKAVSITHPHAGSQASLFKVALRNARLAPNDIDFFELHGTGTQAGDVAETTAVMETFASSAPRSDDRPLYISSVKPNVGHSECAAGLTSFIKTLLMLRYDKIPPHIGIKTSINQNLPPLSDKNILVPYSPKAFQATQPDGKRKIMVNSLAANGGNACLIVEDWIAPRSVQKDPRGSHVVTISGETARSFQDNFQNLYRYVENTPDISIADIGYTATARRMHYRFRKAYAASDRQDLLEQMQRDRAGPVPWESNSSETPTLVFIFGGQGSSRPGMAKQLYQTSQVFRKSISASAEICSSFGYTDLLAYLVSPEAHHTIDDPFGTQLGLLAFEIALTEMWRSYGLEPTAVIGHSLGEYAALYAAGALSVADALFLVFKRAELLQRHCHAHSEKMMAIMSTSSEASNHIQSLGLSATISCYNHPRSIVVSDSSDDLQRLSASLKSKDIKSTVLEVPYAFHSGQMNPLLDEFSNITQLVSFSKLRIPFGSTLFGKFMPHSSTIPDNYLVMQAREPVQFVQTLNEGLESKYILEDTTWLELGPSATCLSFVENTLGVERSSLLASCSPPSSGESQVSRCLVRAYQSGFTVNWKELHREYEHNLALLELPLYAFDLENYWMQRPPGIEARGLQKDVPSYAAEQHPHLGPMLQRATNVSLDSEISTVEFSSNVKDDRFIKVAGGYQIHGLAVCPAAAYAEMARQATLYICERLGLQRARSGLAIKQMALKSPLILDPRANLSTLKVRAMWHKSRSEVKITVWSERLECMIEHAQCSVSMDPDNGLSKNVEGITQSVSRLQRGNVSPNVYRLSKSMVYRLFSFHVRHGEKFQGIEEVYIDKAELTAVANIRLGSSFAQVEETSWNFFCLEAVCHIAGFLANEREEADDDSVQVATGWEQLQQNYSFHPGQLYQSHATLNVDAYGCITASVNVLHKDMVVLIMSGLKFLRMPKDTQSKKLWENLEHTESNEKRADTPMGRFEPSMPKFPRQITSESASQATSDTTSQATSDITKLSEITEPSLSDSRDLGMRSPPPAPTRRSSSPEVDGDAQVDLLRKIIAAKLEVEPEEVTDRADLGALGMNSIHSISILQDFQSTSDCGLPTTFFVENTTLGSARKFFRKK